METHGDKDNVDADRPSLGMPLLLVVLVLVPLVVSFLDWGGEDQQRIAQSVVLGIGTVLSARLCRQSHFWPLAVAVFLLYAACMLGWIVAGVYGLMRD